jgi:hypothetical protein
MQSLWDFLFEALKSGYGTSVLAIAGLWITKPVWLALMRVIEEWVRSAPVRRRVIHEGQAIDRALSAKTAEQGDQAREVLRLLLRAPEPELSGAAAAGTPAGADSSTQASPNADLGSNSPDEGQAGGF